MTGPVDCAIADFVIADRERAGCRFETNLTIMLERNYRLGNA